MAEYDDVPLIKHIQRVFINWFSLTACLPIAAVIISTIYYICMQNTRNGYILSIDGLPVILITLLLCVIIIISMKILKPNKAKGFEKVKDLVRGTIIVQNPD